MLVMCWNVKGFWGWNVRAGFGSEPLRMIWDNILKYKEFFRGSKDLFALTLINHNLKNASSQGFVSLIRCQQWLCWQCSSLESPLSYELIQVWDFLFDVMRPCPVVVCSFRTSF